MLVMDTVKRPTPEVLELVRKIAPKPTLIDEYKSTYGDDAVDQPEVPVVLVLNKIDLALQSKHVHWRANEIWAVGSFKKTFHLSALTGNGVRALKDYLLGEAPPGPWVFPPDMVAALSKVEQVEQLVRTYLLVWFNSRLPYTVQQQTVGWTPRLDGSPALSRCVLGRGETRVQCRTMRLNKKRQWIRIFPCQLGEHFDIQGLPERV